MENPIKTMFKLIIGLLLVVGLLSIYWIMFYSVNVSAQVDICKPCPVCSNLTISGEIKKIYDVQSIATEIRINKNYKDAGSIKVIYKDDVVDISKVDLEMIK